MVRPGGESPILISRAGDAGSSPVSIVTCGIPGTGGRYFGDGSFLGDRDFVRDVGSEIICDPWAAIYPSIRRKQQKPSNLNKKTPESTPPKDGQAARSFLSGVVALCPITKDENQQIPPPQEDSASASNE
ncbi:hypothetical protein FocTR4_00014891 [Fusarium oxysporum f. sp. cubense]|uniref:Uncharacterized protein n=1 Tax=Fusarium oxysporum f. sp. cubense TaxID=61366 RepID=A0A5C6SV17_FUSOC|nr:hypothetical protein FocTR4_00014891 [Fusarium oxysporum f. sp. cubense]